MCTPYVKAQCVADSFCCAGATASTMLVFVLPCVFFIRIDPRPMRSAKKISAAVICAIGLGLMVETLIVIITGYFD